jgi:glycosyltransferase involved in cell wall biosynthesis
MTPMKFLHLTTFYPPYSFGGDAMYIYRLAHALADEGHEVDVVHSVDAYRLLHPAPPEVPFAGHPGVRVHALDTGHRLLTPLITQQTGRAGLNAPAIRALMRDGRHDVVHFHNISLLGPEVLTFPAVDGRTVKLYTTHEHWLVCPTHVLWKFTGRACDRPQCLRCSLASRRPPQLWRHTGMLAAASRHVDRFLSPSRFTAAMHRERGFAAPIGHLPYFIDRTDDDWRNPGPRPHARPYFLFVGRLETIKGLQTIIPLWDKVKKTTDVDLLVAGGGTMERELRALAGGNPKIHFLGPQPQAALGALYVHALACIVPSLTYETFGIVMLEAFARKTPVIARRLGALPEVVEESGGGLTFGDDGELLSAIAALASSPATRTQLGERGYAALVRNWSREPHLARYFDIIEEVRAAKHDAPTRPGQRIRDTGQFDANGLSTTSTTETDERLSCLTR